METGDWQGRRTGRTAGIHRSVVCHAANGDRRNRKSEPDLRDGERFLLAALGDLNPIASVATSGAIRIVGDEREFPGRALRAAQSALRSSRAVQSVGDPQALPRAEMTHHPPNHFRCAILQDGGSNCIDHTSSGYSRVGSTRLRTYGPPRMWPEYRRRRASAVGRVRSAGRIADLLTPNFCPRCRWCPL